MIGHLVFVTEHIKLSIINHHFHDCAGDPPPEELLYVRGDGDQHLAADQLPRARLQQLLRQPHPLRAPLPALPHWIQAGLNISIR